MTNRTRAYLKFVIAVVGVVGIVSSAYGRSREFVDPAPVQIGCTLSQDKVLKAISSGLVGRGWYLTSKKPGDLVAKIIVRNKHTLVVAIKYTNKMFDIDYKSSDNLNYHESDGKKYLHPYAISWMNNLSNDIQAQLSLYCTS
jgi:hypothetical protein